MGLSGSDRGQAIQIGAILIFGIIILFLTLYQATAVPAQNERVEFRSYLEATSNMEGLRNDIQYAASRDTTIATVVQTGVPYPTRAVFVNPGPPPNRIRSGEERTFVLSNASAVNSEAANTGLFWDGRAHTYDTRHVRLDTDYNELTVPSVIVGPGAVYRPVNDSVSPPYGPEETILLSDQSVIEGDRLTLVSVAGDVDAGTGRPVIVSQPVSAHTRTVVVENSTGNVTVTVPTDLSATTWETELLAEEEKVVRVTQNGSAVDVVLEPGAYQLRLAKVEVRQQVASRSVPDTPPEYVLGVTGDGAAISVDQTTPVTVEVRDRFNNPKSGVPVTFNATNGTFARNGQDVRTVTTDGEGRATVLFDPSSIGDATVVAARDTNDDGNLSDEAPLNRTNFSIGVDDATGLDGTSNPATAAGDAAGVVVLQTEVRVTNEQGNSGYKNVTFSLQNKANETVNVTGVRLSYATHSDQSGTLEDGPDSIVAVTLRNQSTNDVVAATSDGFPATEGREPVFFDKGAFSLNDSSTYEFDMEMNERFKMDKQKEGILVSVTLYFEGGFYGEYTAHIFDA